MNTYLESRSDTRLSDRDLVRWIILRFEGTTFTNHPVDKGGPTRHGVTQETLGRWLGRPATIDDVRWLTLDMAVEVMFSLFLFAPKLYQVEDPLVKLCAVDFAIHSGPTRGVRSLQYAAFPGPPYDGQMGPITAKAVNTARPDQMRRDMLAYRLRFLGKLVSQRPSQAVFASGWSHRLATLLELEPGDTLPRAA